MIESFSKLLIRRVLRVGFLLLLRIRTQILWQEKNKLVSDLLAGIKILFFLSSSSSLHRITFSLQTRQGRFNNGDFCSLVARAHRIEVKNFVFLYLYDYITLLVLVHRRAGL